MTVQSPILITNPNDSVCLLTLNRPVKRNALDAATIQALKMALQRIANDVAIRVVMLNGGGEHFCAGADMGSMQKIAQATYAENVDDALQLAELLYTIYHFPKPTIGLVHGATMGGGLGLLACCDMVIAATDSTFCFSETKIGLTPSVISPYVLAVIGERLARYYFLTAEKFDADKAMNLQLVQQVVLVENLFEAGLTLAKTLLKNSPHALLEVKKLIQKVSQQPISEHIMQLTAEHLASMRSSPDAQEGLKAFLEKRLPVWG